MLCSGPIGDYPNFCNSCQAPYDTKVYSPWEGEEDTFRFDGTGIMNHLSLQVTAEASPFEFNWYNRNQTIERLRDLIEIEESELRKLLFLLGMDIHDVHNEVKYDTYDTVDDFTSAYQTMEDFFRTHESMVAVPSEKPDQPPQRGSTRTRRGAVCNLPTLESIYRESSRSSQSGRPIQGPSLEEQRDACLEGVLSKLKNQEQKRKEMKDMADARSEVATTAGNIRTVWTQHFSVFNKASKNCQLQGYSSDRRNWNFPPDSGVDWDRNHWKQTDQCNILFEAGEILFPSDYGQSGPSYGRKTIKTHKKHTLGDEQLFKAYCHSISNMLSVTCPHQNMDQKMVKNCQKEGNVFPWPGEHPPSFVHETDMFKMKAVMSKCKDFWDEQFKKVHLKLNLIASSKSLKESGDHLSTYWSDQLNYLKRYLQTQCKCLSTGEMCLNIDVTSSGPCMMRNSRPAGIERRHFPVSHGRYVPIYCLTENSRIALNGGRYPVVGKGDYISPCPVNGYRHLLRLLNMFPDGSPAIFVGPPSNPEVNIILKKLDDDYEIFKKLPRRTAAPSGNARGNARDEVIDLVKSPYCEFRNLGQARDKNGDQGQNYRQILQEWKRRRGINEKGMLDFVPILERAAFDICIHYWEKYIEGVVECGRSCLKIPQDSSIESLLQSALSQPAVSRGSMVSFARSFFDAFPFILVLNHALINSQPLPTD